MKPLRVESYINKHLGSTIKCTAQDLLVPPLPTQECVRFLCGCGGGGSAFVSDRGDIVHTMRMALVASVES